MEDNQMNTNELYHHGVKGMKWGVRRAKRYIRKAQTARRSADEWDEIAGYAEARGNNKAASSYRSNAAKDRRDADTYENKARMLNERVSAVADSPTTAKGKSAGNKALTAIGKGVTVAAISATTTAAMGLAFIASIG
jgi:hypothetical protein